MISYMEIATGITKKIHKNNNNTQKKNENTKNMNTKYTVHAMMQYIH